MGIKDYFTNKRLNRLERDLRMIHDRYNFDATKAIDLSSVYGQDAFTHRIQEYQVWKSGSGALIRHFYTNGHSTSTDGLNYFWQKALSHTIKRHTGIPKLISNKMGTILFGSDFKVEANVYQDENASKPNETASKQAQEVIDALTDKCKLLAKFRDMAVKESWCGHSFIKFNYDLSLSQYPILETFDLTQAEAVVERGVTKAIIFKSYYTKKKSLNSNEVDKFRFEETYSTNQYGDATIENHLYKLQANGEAKEVALTTIPETEKVLPFYTYEGLKGMLAFHKPNKLPNNEFSHSVYGASDYEGAIDSFDALDEIYSELAYETRNNKTIRFMPSTMLPRFETEDGSLGAVNWDIMGFITAFQMIEGSLDQSAKNEPIVQQIQDKTTSLIEKFKNALVTAINNAGLSPLALGITGLEAVNAGESSQRERNRVTLETRKDKINNYWNPFLVELFTQLIAFNNWLIKRAGAKQNQKVSVENLDFETVDITFDFGNYVVENETEVITRWGAAKQSGLASIETGVREIHPEWTDDQVLEEVTRIKFENNIGVDDPSLLQMNMIDEQPIDTIVEEKDTTKEEVNATTTGEGTL